MRAAARAPCLDSRLMSAVKRVIVVVGVVALTFAATAGAAGPITGKVRGVFVRNAYDGTLDQAV